MSREAKLEARALAIAEACLAAGTPELLELALAMGPRSSMRQQRFED